MPWFQKRQQHGHNAKKERCSWLMFDNDVNWVLKRWVCDCSQLVDDTVSLVKVIVLLVHVLCLGIGLNLFAVTCGVFRFH